MRTLADVLATVERTPDGTLFTRAGVLKMFGEVGAEVEGAARVSAPGAVPASWAERVWTVPDQMQLSAEQCADAIGRSKSALYQLTRRNRIPHGKRDGVLVFQADQIRTWLADEMETITEPDAPFVERVA